jgi:hypothetical protein
MSYIELNSKDLRRLLSILSEYFGNFGMDKLDTKIRNKLEIMLESETEYEENSY